VGNVLRDAIIFPSVATLNTLAKKKQSSHWSITGLKSAVAPQRLVSLLHAPPCEQGSYPKQVSKWVNVIQSDHQLLHGRTWSFIALRSFFSHHLLQVLEFVLLHSSQHKWQPRFFFLLSLTGPSRAWPFWRCPGFSYLASLFLSWMLASFRL
jgi:hypothetical protein